MTSDGSACWNWRVAVRGVCSHQFHSSNQRSEYVVISRPAAYHSRPTTLACDLFLKGRTHTLSLSILNSHQLYNISTPLPPFRPRNFFSLPLPLPLPLFKHSFNNLIVNYYFFTSTIKCPLKINTRQIPHRDQFPSHLPTVAPHSLKIPPCQPSSAVNGARHPEQHPIHQLFPDAFPGPLHPPRNLLPLLMIARISRLRPKRSLDGGVKSGGD